MLDPGAASAAVEPVAVRSEPTATACDRCGTYADVSDVVGRALCDACRERRKLRVDESPVRSGRLLGDVVAVLRVVTWMPFVAVFIVMIPWATIVTIAPVPPIFGLLYTPVDVLADVAIIQMTCDAVRGEKPRLWYALGIAFQRWPVLIATSVLSLALGAIGLFVFVVPAIIVALGLTLALAFAGVEHARPVAALRQSWNTMRGHKSALFFALVPLIVAGFVAQWISTSVVQALWSSDLWFLLPPWSVDPVAYVLTFFFAAVLYPLCFVPMRILPAVLYVKLRRAGSRESRLILGPPVWASNADR